VLLVWLKFGSAIDVAVEDSKYLVSKTKELTGEDES
jgi:hypothetical protein